MAFNESASLRQVFLKVECSANAKLVPDERDRSAQRARPGKERKNERRVEEGGDEGMHDLATMHRIYGSTMLQRCGLFFF